MTRILLVEDDPVAQDLVKGILESRGWVVDTAGDGFASINMLRERSYTAALIDYHLPEMDGYALARLMRDICSARQQSLRLIGMTADRHGLAGRRGVDSVFDDILAKPFAPGDLLALLDKVASRGGSPYTFAETASALLAHPGSERARAVSESMWRGHGLAALPKVHVVPTPTSDQVDAIRLCFDIVDEAAAELVLIVDALGFHDLIRARASAAARLPIVALDPALSIIADGLFVVSDPTSWSDVATLVRREMARRNDAPAGPTGETAAIKMRI